MCDLSDGRIVTCINHYINGYQKCSSKFGKYATKHTVFFPNENHKPEIN